MKTPGIYRDDSQNTMFWGKETGLVTKPSRINTVMEDHGLIFRPESALRPDPVDSRQDLTTSMMKKYMRSPGPSPKGGQPFDSREDTGERGIAISFQSGGVPATRFKLTLTRRDTKHPPDSPVGGGTL